VSWLRTRHVWVLYNRDLYLPWSVYYRLDRTKWLLDFLRFVTHNLLTSIL